MRIDSILETGQRKKTVTICIDSGEEIRVDAAFIEAHSIREGMEIEDGQWDAWLSQWHRRRAMDAALTYLGYRSRTRAQMEEYLKGKGFPSAAIAETMDKLAGYGYLDDMRYAREYLSSLRGGRPLGRVRIKIALKERGVAEEIIEEALTAYGEEEELAQAVACLQKQIALRQGKSPEIRRKQCYAALARRGFNWETIRRAWGALAQDAEDDT